jgi:hypothetical protein
MVFLNPNIDLKKWYLGYKENHIESFGKFKEFKKADDKLKNKIIKNIIDSKYKVFPRFAEMKIVIEQMKDKDNLDAINKIIKMFDSANIKEFNEIYSAYKKLFDNIQLK